MASRLHFKTLQVIGRGLMARGQKWSCSLQGHKERVMAHVLA